MNNNNIIHSNTSSTGYINSHNVIYNYDLSEIKDKLEPLQKEFDYNLDNNSNWTFKFGRVLRDSANWIIKQFNNKPQTDVLFMILKVYLNLLCKF